MSGLPFKMQSWKVSSKASIASDFATLLRIKQGAKRKRCHSKSDSRLWQVTYFSTKNPIDKLAMNNRRLLIAAEFHCTSSGKRQLKNHKLTEHSVSFICQSKQDSRCCINFPHELTCQILTNQSIKIERRAWPTRDHVEQSQKQLSSLRLIAGWIFASEVSFKSKLLCGTKTEHISYEFTKKLNLSLRSIEN